MVILILIPLGVLPRVVEGLGAVDHPMEVGVVVPSCVHIVAKLIMLWTIVGRSMVILLIYITYSKVE
jgi:hypothetical protein